MSWKHSVANSPSNSNNVLIEIDENQLLEDSFGSFEKPREFGSVERGWQFQLKIVYKGLRHFVGIVGSCNGVLCLPDAALGCTGRAALWNPTVRKIVTIPCPNVVFSSHGPFMHSLGFGFDSTTLFDGSLLRVSFKKLVGEEVCCSVWMMKDYGVAGSWTRLFNISHLEGVQRLVAVRQNGKVQLAKGGKLVFYDPKTEKILDTEIFGHKYSFFLDTFVESLVLLSEANEFTKEKASEVDSANGVSKELSSSLDGVGMKVVDKNSEGKKNANNPITLNKANEILEEDASSSSSQIVINKAKGGSKEEA
ncbi:hypothetical protein GH714_002583 [Hevea brasiliensis]|uniref:F-box associated domain-containing protein n=1 Tax=Hevea brasiliensis TaxID=3981 RepID=A0A6A6L022_HEVBR|nr:hypothetical protein GH714_002583 [Hevea brasiliensis]